MNGTQIWGRIGWLVEHKLSRAIWIGFNTAWTKQNTWYRCYSAGCGTSCSEGVVDHP